MLTIQVPITKEGFDNRTQTFVPPETFELELEHSLVSLSKWEEEFEKPFLSSDAKTQEETLRYIQLMTLTPNVPDFVWERLSPENGQQINDYIGAKMSATWFNEPKTNTPSREVITSELIYYWLVALQIPFDPVQNWHLNKLLTLVKVTNLKSQPPKKMGRAEAIAQHRRLNEQRKQMYGTPG